MNCYRCATPIPNESRFCLSCGADVSGDTAEHTIATGSDPELMLKLQEDLGSDFVLERELGRGGMAVVFLGRDTHLGRKVAVKVLPPELTFGSGAMIERFKREAKVAATLDHSNVIPIYRVSTGGKLFWYVMKFLDGEALDHILHREGQLPLDRAADILHQTAAALQYAHKHQVVHRDVKPANIVIDSDGRLTVTDFGIAKALDANTLTASGSMIGTPYYMSPEQCTGKRVGPAADQYSLAVMAYQMLGGHLPFTGESVIDIIRQHCMDPPSPLLVLRPELPPLLCQVVERALGKTPEERFPTVEEFSRAFSAASTGATDIGLPPTNPASGGMRGSRTLVVTPTPGASASLDRPTRKSRLRILLAVLGGLVVVGAGAGIALLRSSPQAAPQKPVPSQAAPLAAMPAAPSPAPDSSAVPPAAGAPATEQAAGARLILRNVPRGAAISVDGRRRSGNITLAVGREHTVRVEASGFQPWSQSVTPRDGRPVTLTAQLVPLAVATAPQPVPVQSQAVAAQPQAEPPPAVVSPPAVTGSAYVTVGSRPLSSISINGRPQQGNPVSNVEVPAGAVIIRFTVTDSSGSWSDERTFDIAPGERKNLRRIELRRP
jgi:serine/threonine protein kinase